MFFLNLDFLYYLVYLFFRSIWDFFVGIFTNYDIKNQDDFHINLLDLFNYYTQSDKLGFEIGGIDGYSLFTPPNGAESWGKNIFEAIGNWFYVFFHNPYCPSCPSFAEMFFGGINAFIIFMIFIALFLLYLLKIREGELAAQDYEINEKVIQKKEDKEIKDEKWGKILEMVESSNKNDWKAAVMDADNMLDEILIRKGYPGKTLGERLKAADFTTVQKAWEAHKIRNLIAHDANFELTRRDAKKAILNFSIVFKEIL